MIINCTQCPTQLLAIRFLSSLPLKKVLIGTTMFTAIVAMLIPGIVELASKYILVALVMVEFGIFMAVINSGIVGYIGMLRDPLAMNYYMMGCSLNSLIILVVQIICLLALPDNITNQAILYFCVTGSILLLTCFSFHKLTVKYPIQKIQALEMKECVKTFKEIWPEAIGITVVFMTTYSCFPGLLLSLKWFGMTGPWMPVLVVGISNLCDFTGRTLTTWIPSPPKKALRIITYLRLIFVVMVILALPNCNIEILQNSSVYSLLVSMALCMSNGFTCSWTMVTGCSSAKNGEVAGYIMAFFLTLGLALGAVAAPLLGLAFLKS